MSTEAGVPEPSEGGPPALSPPAPPPGPRWRRGPQPCTQRVFMSSQGHAVTSGLTCWRFPVCPSRTIAWPRAVGFPTRTRRRDSVGSRTNLIWASRKCPQGPEVQRSPWSPCFCLEHPEASTASPGLSLQLSEFRGTTSTEGLRLCGLCSRVSRSPGGRGRHPT